MPAVRLPQRFQLIRELGRGGMGAVYEAFDREAGGRVAIKTLPSHDAMAIARFKREFRALADLHHPNLVALGELFCEDGEWAFSMDLIEGGDLLEHICEVRASDGTVRVSSEGDENATASAAAAAPVARHPRLSDPPPPAIRTRLPRWRYNEQRLRASFSQLALAVGALHDAGKIHRDIKPSNVRVRPDGHVFLLDFGLVAELTTDGALTGHQNALGTPAYMAPEQASGGTVGAFSDWYSVGVVLFEALTGRLPFEGAPIQMMIAKQKGDAPSVRLFAPDAPADLESLCARLLAFDPEARPSAATVLRMLAASGVVPAVQSRAFTTQGSGVTAFVGRRSELRVLEIAFSRVVQGHAVAVLLEGESGTGKSLLAKTFIERALAEQPKTTVISGRCYENEAVPYNAWDSAIDCLAEHWRRSDPSREGSLVPIHRGALLQTFPALRRVAEMSRLPTQDMARLDPREVRSRAFSALREVFERLSQRGPVIVHLDDVQWADHDSVSLLAEVLREPSPPPLLLLATTRTLADFPEVERELRDALPRSVERVLVSELPHEDAVELAAQLLARETPELVGEAESIAREGAGHAFFIAELVRHVRSGGRKDWGVLSLADALSARVAELDEMPRALIEVLSVAARPVPETIALRAASVDPTQGPRALSALRVGHLSRTTRIEGADWLETYHDRIRYAVLARLDPEVKRTLLEQLAVAFDGTIYADPALLTDLWKAAGDAERAGRHAWPAGDRACAALAFDRAAALYQVALDRPSCTAKERTQLLVILADTLAKGGRGKEAADTYQLARGAVGELEALELDRKTGEQLLRTGHYDEGVAITKRVLARIGVRFPETILEALATIAVLRIALFLRGPRFVARRESDVDREELTRIDVCHDLGPWLALVDAMRATVFQYYNLRFALRSGELGRVSRATSLSLTLVALLNGGATPRRSGQVAKAIERAHALAQQSGDPYARAIYEFAAGGAWTLSCQPRRGLEHLERGEQYFRNELAGKNHEIATSQLFGTRACFYLGELRKLCALQSRGFQESCDRRDLYGMIQFRFGTAHFAWLVRDDVAGAELALSEGLGLCSAAGFATERALALLASTNTALYRGDARAAADGVLRGWDWVKRSAFRLFPVLRVETSEYRARVHLAAALSAPPSERSRQLRLARSWARDTARANAGFARPMALFLRSQIALVGGDREEAVRLLRDAMPKLIAEDLHGYATMAKRALGTILRGEEGAVLVHEAEQALRQETVKSIPALCRCLAPGFALLD